MKKRISNVAIAILMSVTLGTSLYGCKENTIINSNLVPTVDNINTFQFPEDSIQMRVKTIIDDSVVTSYSVSPIYVGVGAVHDAAFGDVFAGAYFQFIQGSSSGYTFPTAVDSAVLILPYSGFSWGDTTSSLTNSINYTVYRVMDTTFTLDSTYHSFRRLPLSLTPISASTPITLSNIRKPTAVDTTVQFLRIKLSDDFVKRLYDSTTQHNSYAAFTKEFNGVYVCPTDTNNAPAAGGAIHYFRLDGTTAATTAGVLFYYKDTVRTSFGFNQSFNPHFTAIKRDYNKATGVTQYNIKNYIRPTSDTTSNDSLVFLQNEPGAAIDVIIPNIQKIPKSLINKAELLLTLTDPDNQVTKLFPPGVLYPVGVEEDGTLYSITDRYPINSTAPLTFIDGTVKSIVSGNNVIYQYSINFPRELQHAIAIGKTKLHLRINGTQTFPGAYRLIAGGKGTGTNNAYRMKLNIIYSKLN